MSSGLTHNGAVARGLAYAPAAPTRAASGAAEARITAMRPVEAVRNVAQARAELREKVMAERGVNAMSLMLAEPQERIRAELAVRTDAAVRTLTAEDRQRAYVRPTGNFVDIRV